MLYAKFLDLGNEDSINIELPNGDDILIDGGEYCSEEKIIEFLNAQDLDEGDGVRNIEYIINTHPHSDHTAGLIGVLRALR